MPMGMFDPMPEVIATMENGSKVKLFSFYPNELTFQAAEFVGMTLTEARELFHKKDVEFLRG